ncbi:MAG: DUF1786 family protein [Dehalococcoidia bacterium]
MRLLALDIGGLTQDILLLDTSQVVENCVKMVMPSPTIALASKIVATTKAKRSLLLTGVNMGGGFSKRALINHIRAGLPAYATAEAAATFDDDIDEVTKWGVRIVGEGEMPQDEDVVRIETRDLELAAIEKALLAFDVSPHFDAIAVAVFDHGAAPAGVSDRLFRFQYLRQAAKLRRQLIAFAYLADEIPSHLTRMKAVAQSVDKHIPLLVMDSSIAAVLGSLEDKEVTCHAHTLAINAGNFHTLAFHLQHDSVLGFLEHHTHQLTTGKLEDLVVRLVKGKLSHEEVYNDGGHGCLILESRNDVPFVSVTGPQRALMSGSNLKPYFAAPYGDMMLTGCFGLVRAFAMRVETWGTEIQTALNKNFS